MGNSFNISDALLIAALSARVDTVDTVVDAIRAVDVPALMVPQQVRGDFSFATLLTADAVLQTVLDVTGSGILLALTVRCTNNAYTVQSQITIDGVSSSMHNPHTGDTLYRNLQMMPKTGGPTHNLSIVNEYPNIISPFSTSLLVQVREMGGAGNVECNVIYSLDNF